MQQTIHGILLFGTIILEFKINSRAQTIIFDCYLFSDVIITLK